jgi:hypothetical protein
MMNTPERIAELRARALVHMAARIGIGPSVGGKLRGSNVGGKLRGYSVLVRAAQPDGSEVEAVGYLTRVDRTSVRIAVLRCLGGGARTFALAHVVTIERAPRVAVPAQETKS